MAFKNRWRIQGTLTTKTPLHVGNGDVTTRTKLVEESTKKPIEISAVATDHQGRAYIPATTLKGNLRSWLGQQKVPWERITTVFGSEDPSVEDAVGGKAEFWHAFSVNIPDPPPQVPYWDATRLTGVVTSVAIDRRTRTASPNKLFHEEFVPPGVKFEITVAGQDLEPEEIHLLLFALEGFNHAQNPVSLGADTGDDQGRFTWELTDIAQISKGDVAAWLQKQPSPVGYDGLVSLKAADRKAMRADALTAFCVSSPASLTLSLELRFEGPFLVNDPSRTKKSRRSLQTNNDIPDHTPLRDHQSRLLLPARSVRGAVRSQAEKIIRTLNPEAACLAVDPEDACKPLYEYTQRATHLCLACQVFGAPGWRAPLEISDFLLAESSTETPFSQEFLAIDRFTGGGARHLKFEAVTVYKPTLTGVMRVDLKRIDPWALGLLALTLRDLIEGDIPLGFGVAKGYGASKAVIRGIYVTPTDLIPEDLRTLLKSQEALEIDFNSLDTTSKPPDAVQYVAMALVEAFLTKVAGFKRKRKSAGERHALS